MTPWGVWGIQKARPRRSCSLGIGPQHQWTSGGELQQGKVCPSVPSALQSSFAICWGGKPIPGARAELEVAAGPAPLWVGGVVPTLCSLMCLQGSPTFLRTTWLLRVPVASLSCCRQGHWSPAGINRLHNPFQRSLTWACFCSSVLLASASYYLVAPG